MSHRYVWPACKGKQQSVLTLAVDCFCRLNTDSCCFRAVRDWFGRRMATSTWGCNGQCIHSVWNTHIYIYLDVSIHIYLVYTKLLLVAVTMVVATSAQKVMPFVASGSEMTCSSTILFYACITQDGFAPQLRSQLLVITLATVLSMLAL